MRAIPLILVSFLLLACSGGIGGAPGSGGAAGPVGDTAVGGPLGGNGSAAQPLDAGFSGPSKDVHGYNYVLREAKVRAICKEGNDDVRVRVSGQVFNDQTQHGVAGFLRINDLTADRYLVTRAANEPEVGRFSTVMRLRPAFDLSFFMLVTNEEPAQLDVLLPAVGGGLIQVIKAELLAPLTVENGDTDFPCVEAAVEGNDYQSAEDRLVPAIVD